MRERARNRRDYGFASPMLREWGRQFYANTINV